MKCAIFGPPYSGKSTLFAAVGGHRPDPGSVGQEHHAVVKVPDPRLDFLAELHKPKKTTHATLELLDLPEPGFTKICIAPESPDQPSAYRKPSPLFVLEMVKKYRLDTTQCYMVGDRLCDLDTGLNAFIKSVAISSGNDLSDEMKALITENQIPVFQNLKAFIDSLLG